MLKCARRSVKALSSACIRRGAGEPFVLKGAARDFRLMGVRNNDTFLLEQYAHEARNRPKARNKPKKRKGKEVTVSVEEGKKESRAGRQYDVTLSQFVKGYNTSDWYAVGLPPVKMLADVSAMPFLTCGGFQDRLVSRLPTPWLCPGLSCSAVRRHRVRLVSTCTICLQETALLWMSSGGTNSVLHYDSEDNMNCLFSGRKRMTFHHPKWKDSIETAEMGWIDIDSARGAAGQYKTCGARAIAHSVAER